MTRLLGESVGQACMSVHRDGIPVRDENALHGKSEQRLQCHPESGAIDARRQPRLRAQAQPVIVVTEENIARDDGAVLGDPVDDLGRAAARQCLDTARKGIAWPEDGGSDSCSTLVRRASAARRVQASVVPLHDLAGASRMPKDRDEDVDRQISALHIPVEGFPEPGRLRLAGRDEWVDQDDRVGCLVVDTADLVTPLLVPRCPAPEPVGDQGDLHAR